MDAPIKIALAGIGGYGDAYLEALLPKQDVLRARLVGVVEPYPQRCKHLRELQDARVPIHNTMRGLFTATPVDLMLIVTPIHLHAAQTCFALQHGANVLCEKPVAGTLHDAMHMAQTQADAKGFAAIGYQWSFSQAIQSLKRDVIDGVLGKPIRLKAMACLPRPTAYFHRNDWAGRMHTDDGQGIFDSPANNAAAHFLHNMFYVLGATRESSATPATVQAELYRANEIENYDTAAIRCVTDCGVEILFYTSHAVPERRGPRSRYEFENATVEYDALATGQFIARFRDGRVKHYGHPNLDRHEKIWHSIESVRTGKPVACGIEAAMPHAICVAAAQESAGGVTEFPERLRAIFPIDGDAMIGLASLGEQMTSCYDAGSLPSECDELSGGALDWARRGATIHCHATAGVGSNGNGNGDGKVDGNGRHVTVTVHAPAAPAAPAAANPWTPSTSQ